VQLNRYMSEGSDTNFDMEAHKNAWGFWRSRKMSVGDLVPIAEDLLEHRRRKLLWKEFFLYAV
jgi:hypothetical protein